MQLRRAIGALKVASGSEGPVHQNPIGMLGVLVVYAPAQKSNRATICPVRGGYATDDVLMDPKPETIW